ncbi:MAG: calcium/sodium antiporter [Planctomycetaceae bacterium]
MSTLLLIAGLVVLTVGADMLVRAASSLALAMKISPLVIGLTIVAFGTSAPELVVSLQSSLAGQSDIALGNVVGSNIFNVLFILGVSALITPLVVAQQLVRFDVPLMIGLSALVLLMGADGSISRVDGSLLVLGVIAYTTYAIRCGRQESAEVSSEYTEAIGQPAQESPPAGRLLRDIAITAVGLGLLVFGSRLFVSGAIDIARGLGVSELVIGLTLVAAGTSLPEVATSVVAAWKGERDIAVGNVVGSNIFNILAVLGASGLASNSGVAVSPAALEFDLPVMLAVAVACLPVFFTGHMIARWEGLVFLAYYLVYVTYLFLASTGHAWMGSFHALLLWIVIPLTVLTLAVGLVRERQARQRAASGV